MFRDTEAFRAPAIEKSSLPGRLVRTYGDFRTEIRVGRTMQPYRMPAFEALSLARRYEVLMQAEG